MGRKILGLTVCVALLVSLVGGVGLAQAKEVTLTVVGDAGHNLRPFEWYEDEFFKKFGVKLKVIGVPFAEVYEKEKIEFVTHSGAYDIVVVFPKFMGDFAGNGYLVDLDEYAKKLDPKMDDVTPGYGELYCKYGGKLYAVPFDGDVLNLYYRKDLFDSGTEKAAFKAGYGYDLKPPATWKEYLEVAKFFTRKKGEKLAGEVLNRDFYGTAFYGQRDWAWAWWGNRFGTLGGVYFDERNMKPAINSKAGVDALNDMIAIKEFCPPDVLAFGYEELKDAFLNGETSMVIQWPCVGKKGADPEQSNVVGKVGVAGVPGGMVKGKLYRRAMMPCGRVLAVTKDSKYPWEAYQVIQYLTTVTSLDDVSTAETGLDPYRYSHFAQPEAYGMFADVESAKIYLAGVEANMEVGYPELTIPGAAQYEDVLGLEVTKALAGEKSAEVALNAAAKEWTEITKRFGLKEQRKLYQALVKGWREAGLWK